MISHKLVRVLAFPVVAGLVVVALAALSSGATPTRAQSTADDIDVTITLTGTVMSINNNVLTLTDGALITLPEGFVLPPGIAPGITVTITAQIDDDDLVAIIIVIVSPATGTPSATPTETPTLTPTATAAPTMAATGTAVATVACGSGNTQPVAQRLATAFNVPYAEIMNWHCEGFGFGEIAKAYALAKATAGTPNAMTAAQIFALRQGGEGWGQIMKQFGVKPNELAPGLIIKIHNADGNSPAGKPTKAKGNKNGKGNGNGNGKGNGNGNDH